MLDNTFDYSKGLIYFTLIIGTLAAMMFWLVIPQYYLPIFPVLFIFFPILSLTIKMLASRFGKKNHYFFSFMLSNSLKIVIYLIFIIIYVILDRTNATAFVVTFLILYTLFTFFDVISIVRNRSQLSK